MNWKNGIPFAMALAFGLIAAKVGRDAFTRSARASSSNSAMAAVVIAQSDLEAGAVIGEKDLVVSYVPPSLSPRGSFSTAKDLVGRIAVGPVFKGQVVIEPMLVTTGSTSLVPNGMRAVTVEINEFSGVAGLLSPGARVDVMATLTADRASMPMTKTVMQDVCVVAVGVKADPPPGRKPERADPATVGRSVTLLVSPRQAEILEFISSSARLRLALRGQVDRETGATAGISAADLIPSTPSSDWTSWTPPAPAPQAVVVQPTTRPVEPAPMPKPATRVRVVEVINGSESSTVQYPQKQSDQPKNNGGAHD